MEVFFTATLLISVIGLVSLLWVKNWEIRTGHVLMAGVRPRVGVMSHSFLIWIERVLPRLVTVYARRTARAVENWMHRATAYGLLAAEHGLERGLHSLRGVTEKPRANREASAFLREVAAHKKKLLHRKKQGTEE